MATSGPQQALAADADDVAVDGALGVGCEVRDRLGDVDRQPALGEAVEPAAEPRGWRAGPCAVISVSMKPGATALTVMPRRRSRASAAYPSTRPMTPALEAA